MAFMRMPASSGEAGFPYPSLNGLPHLAQPALKEMVCALDDDQLFGFGQRFHEGLQLGARPKLIAASTDKEFGFAVRTQARQIVCPHLDRLHRKSQANGGNTALVIAHGLQSDGRAKRKSRQDGWQLKLPIQPIECGAHIFDFALPVVVLAVAETSPAKVKAQ